MYGFVGFVALPVGTKYFFEFFLHIDSLDLDK